MPSTSPLWPFPLLHEPAQCHRELQRHCAYRTREDNAEVDVTDLDKSGARTCLGRGRCHRERGEHAGESEEAGLELHR